MATTLPTPPPTTLDSARFPTCPVSMPSMGCIQDGRFRCPRERTTCHTGRHLFIACSAPANMVIPQTSPERMHVGDAEVWRGCALRECVTAERTVGAPAAPQSPFERDETAGSLLEATLLARSQTCTSASPATIVGALARVKDCEAPGAPRGEGRVRLSYSMSGELVSAVVDQAPFAGTQVAGCVEAKFRGTRIRPYQGADLVLERRFLVP